MRHWTIRGAIVTLMLLTFAHPALAQTLKGPVSDKPLTENWAPSKWGRITGPARPTTRATPRTSRRRSPPSSRTRCSRSASTTTVRRPRSGLAGGSSSSQGRPRAAPSATTR